MKLFGWLYSLAGLGLGVQTVRLVIYLSQHPGEGRTLGLGTNFDTTLVLFAFLSVMWLCFGLTCLHAVYRNSTRSCQSALMFYAIYAIANCAKIVIMWPYPPEQQITTIVMAGLIDLAISSYYAYAIWSFYKELLAKQTRPFARQP
ncbi:MARVEL domain-containing protein [Plasmodiophora brassicae]